ncbi:MAG: hypothetical protein LQ351_005503 [Letrouitia transgressa]|nr:MAG: hypothetical protein LQ351_005503 [Letrouitia transgressa]
MPDFESTHPQKQDLCQPVTCKLMLLDGNAKASARLIEVEVEVRYTEKLQELYNQDKAHLEGVICTAWGLLLRCFNGQDEVSFRLKRNESLHTADFTQKPLPAMQFLFHENDSLLTYIKQAETKLSSTEKTTLSSSTSNLVNTALCVLDTEHSSLAIQNNPHNSPTSYVLKGEIELLADLRPGVPKLSIRSSSADVSQGYLTSLANALEQTLTDAIFRPQAPLSDLTYVNDRHMKEIWKWTPDPDEQRNACIHDLIYEQALVRPEKEAVSSWDGTLTYRELWAHVGQLAQMLVELNVGPETIVPLCFEKSIWSVVAMLAVMEAGAGFCPLDATQPNTRLKSLASRLKAPLLLCSRRYSQDLSSVVNQILPIDADTIGSLREPLCKKLSRATPNNIAYVLWTSGSTGEPKGVVIEHRAYCSAAKTHAPAFCMSAESRILQYASYTFDASIIETLTSLMIGATICIPSEYSRINDLPTAFSQLRANWAALTPSVVNFLSPSIVPGLQTLLLMGEAMSQEHISTWSSIKLLNGYGPAECSVAAVANSDVSLAKEPTLIGRGIGVRCWLVDPENHDRLLPPGCVAELVIEGPTLARGYLSDPERTDAAFIQSPAWARTNASKHLIGRMYKTGDLVRYNTSNGMLYFVGRKDSQVKVHGQRIELGEIEHHLKEESAIRQSMTIVPKSGLCKQRLVAIISLQSVLTAKSLISATDLHLIDRADQEKARPIIALARERLSSRLPAFMIPSLWFVVQSIPLLRSGKLDRKTVYTRIHEMSEETYSQWVQSDEGDEQPASELESQLRSIWGHVLNLRPAHISLKQPFLSLGGDSISAMMVQSHCKKNSIGITVQDILRAKSISHLATLVQAISRSAKQEERIEEDFDLSPIQRLYFDLPNRGKGHFNQSVFVRLTRTIRPAMLHQAAKSIVNRHSMLRARFHLSEYDDEWKQRITTDITGSYSFRTYDCNSKEDAIPFISRCQASIDPVRGPLFAINLFNLQDGGQLLFMTAHHLVVDLVSWRIILQDVEELLTNPKLVTDMEPSLPFQIWSEMQIEHSHKIPLSTVLPVGDIPRSNYVYWEMADRPNLYGDVRCEGFQLDVPTTALITTKSQKALRTDTVDMVVAAMLFSFSQTFADREPPTIFNEGHGREAWKQSIDLSRTVGWFTTMYPISLSPSQDFVDVLRRVKDFRRALPANGRPYFASRMLTSKGSKKFAGQWPLEITFNYLGIYQQLEREDALLMPVEEMAGEARGAGGKADVGFDTPRFGLFEISAVIAQGQLRFSFTFNKHMKHQEKILSWISACRDVLVSMPPVLAQKDYRPTLSDYPLLSLTYENLEQLIDDRLPSIGITDVRDVEDIYRCSQIQQGLLISKQRDEAFYAVEGVYKVNSKDGVLVNGNKVADAWQSVVNRHASLRTIFVDSLSQDEALYDQIVLKSAKANIVRRVCEKDSDAIEALRSQPPMEQDDRSPPHRFTICETNTGNVFCKLEISHTIIDGASMSIIFQELVSFYEGRILRETGPLYSNYIAFLQSQQTQAGIGYWKSYLADAEPTIFPILDDAVCIQRELRSKRLQLNDLTTIQRFCNLHGVTLANVFHTAWALTLKSYTNLNDVSYGYLNSARDQSIEDVDGMVGYLVNMLVCRVMLAPDTPLIETMQQIQTDLSDGQAHCQTALSEVLHALKLSGSSLFNTSLSYRKIPITTTSEQHAVSFDECFPYYDPTEYSVSINIEVSEDTAAIDLDYWTDCLTDGHAANVANTFLQALENITERSELCIGRLSAVSACDSQQISTWNSSMPKVIDKCVHDVVGEQMALRPDAAAICAWDGDYTYAELDALALKVAGYLYAQGIGPESYVCLCFEKSAFTIIAMLGVLKVGAAFVSLDPMHPPSALRMRIEDTQTRAILTSPCYGATFAGMGPEVVSIDQAFLDRLKPVQSRFSLLAQPQNPCAVIYTSGSTGKPKGVVLEHRALVTSSKAHGTALGIGPDSRFLQFSSYTFDNTLEEIFTTLMRGGVVCVPSDHDRFNDLAGAITRLRANFMDLTPTVATYLNPSDMPSIKGMALGGEPLTKTVLEVWGDAVQIHNQYGPSECSINATHRTNIYKSSDPAGIGRSVGSVSWIVHPSDHDRLVSIGCEGELLIEGPILARGYLNDPEKTSQMFIEDPAWARNHVHDQAFGPRRMYKTGDLVRYNSDGSISYIGRKDQQVKLHGQRIELGEIEYHIRNNLEADWHFAVDLIMPGSHQASTKALALFVCPQEHSVSATTPESGLLPVSSVLLNTFKDLEAALVKALPKHMVPSLFIPLERLPLTSSGKLDRKQLHSIAKSMNENQLAMFRLAGSNGQKPSTDIEKTLAELWESVLNLEHDSIGVDAQFFRMGGDSIAAIRLVTAARSKGISLTVANIFRNATLSNMCETASVSVDPKSEQSGPEPFELLPAAVSAIQVIDEISDLCMVNKNDIEDIYPCTAIQEGLIALSNKQPGAYVLQNSYHLSSIDVDKFKEAWKAVVATESILRTRILYTDNLGFLQVVTNEGITWSEYDSPEEIPESTRTKPAFNGAGLTDYSIIRGKQNDAFFVWTIHHALYDGWSIGLILDKVQAYYNKSEAADSSIKARVYSKFMQYVTSVDTSESESFWQSKLAGSTSPQFPVLPTPTYQPHVTSTVSHVIHISREAGAETTMPSLIRTAWALTLSAYSNSEDVVYAETVNGRDAPVSGIVEMIGPAFATVPVRIQAARDSSAAEFVKHVQEDTIEAMPHQYLGLQRIKRIDSDTAQACEFQNLIAINGQLSDGSSDFWKPQNIQSSGSSEFFTYALTVSFDISKSDVEMTAHFDPDVIPSWQLRRLIRYFECVLTRLNAPESASLRVGDIQNITDEDETSIKQWNAQPSILINKCIHEVIREKAWEIPPSSPALCSWDVELNYRELDHVATTFACRLRQLGIARQCYVPICFEKSALTVIVMLAVLKAGASFVAIDGESPKARLQGIISDVDAKRVVCSPKHKEVCESLGVETIVVGLQNVFDAPKRLDALPTSSGSDVAYIMFTSGSTGKPKGTLVPHAAFVSGAVAHGPAMRMQATSRVLQFSSYAFDASIVEIFTTLMLGGCVCIPDEKTRLNNITKVINEMKVDWTLLTPSFVQTISPSDVPTLKTLVLGGEAMSQNNLSTWADATHLINAYGPSECAVVATVNSHVSSTSSPSNIGRAVGGHCFIVNQHNHDEIVPIGAIGEMVVVGPILARGYLKNPSKTQESFVRLPKWASRILCPQDVVNDLMYKTGDLMKYAEDGSLLYIGRKDNQTKLHGQRLELGEVEHHIGQVSTVHHGLAVIPGHGLYAKKLVAVLSFKEKMQSRISHSSLQAVTRTEAASHIQTVRDYLSCRLPPYMVPSNWVVLLDIPLLPSGKLDRRLVAAWVESMPENVFREISGTEAEDIKIQGSEVEQRLQLIWSRVLHLPAEQIGLDKNFLYLGGDSISALQASSQCRTEGLGVTVQDIIRCPSISDLATRVTLPQNLFNANEEYGKTFDLSPMQRLFFDWVGSEIDHFNQSVAVKFARTTSPDKVSAAIKALINTHSMLNARFEKSEAGKWTQKLDKEGSKAHRFTVHTGNFSSEQMRSSIITSQKSLDIQKGPIMAVDLFESDDSGSQVLAIVIHHLVVDVVSWGIILEDLESLLASEKVNTQPTLPFQTWLRLQTEKVMSDTSRGIKLDNAVPAADYSFWNMSNQPNLYGDVRTLDFDLEIEATRLLLSSCHRALQTETVDVLLGSILHSFSQAFPERKSTPSIFNEAHGREPWDSGIDLTHTVGWFTTISPVFLPAEATEEQDVTKIIRWVKDQRSRTTDKGRQYFSHRMLSGNAVEAVAGHWPMEIAFNFLGQEKSFKRSGSLFQPLEGWTDSDISASVPRFALFEISASIVDDRLKLSLAYSAKMSRQPVIKSWTTEIKKSLLRATEQLSEMEPSLTLSSFPLLPMSYNTIENLKDRLPSMQIASMTELEDVYGCSPMQQGLLLSQIKDNGQYMYNATFTINPANGAAAVDANRLARAWEKVVQKHSSLRTVFIQNLSQEGLMDQVVLKRVTPTIELLSCNAEKGPLDTLKGQPAIKFTQGKLPHRLTICETSGSHISCKLELSHAICDGTSIPIIFRDFAQLYAKESVENFQAMSYRDYVSFVQQTSRDNDVAYWRRYLDCVEPCYFPALGESSEGVRELRTLELNLKDTSQLQSFCSQNSVTLSNALQLVWALALRAYSGSDSVCFGYLSSGRNVPLQDIENAVGLFISMLICRMDFSDDMLVSKALEQIRDDYTQSMAHQACSLGDVQHELQLSGKSLFNTAFTFQRRPGTQEAEKHEITFDILEAYDPSEYDLTINVEACDADVAVLFNYWTNCLSDKQAQNVSEAFGQILHSIMHPKELQQTIGALESCSQIHREEILEWNKAPLLRVDECAHDIIYRQSQLLPLSAPAVCSWDVDLTYVKLMSLSKRLSKHLAALGVGPETYVPICFEKSTWAIVAMLGVLHAGGAFVPLEPSHPESRIKYILNNVSAKLVLTSAKYCEMFAHYPEITTFIVDDSLNQQSGLLNSEVSAVTPENAAYLIFTSGTTGLPKGAIISHRAFVTSAAGHAPAMYMRQSSRVLQFSNLCFDASILETLTALVTGACICIPSEEERMNDIPGAMNRMSVSWSFLTPSVANVLKPESVPTLKVLVTGGEAMQARHIEKWKATTSVVNGYGPTETVIIVVVGIKVDERGTLTNDDPGVIGRAVACRSWIVNPNNHNQLMPIGSVGELVLDGNTTARGYLNNEEKTAKAFVTRPTWMNEHDRGLTGNLAKTIYMTGDLVRYKSDGNIAYVGRKDTQIKLNGLRIELGEIETRVKENLPENIQSAVEMVAPAGQQQTLAAFFTSPDDASAKADLPKSKSADLDVDSLLLPMSDGATTRCRTLKSNLAGSLPAYMIPSLYIPLSQMPWTPSGKLDRLRLCRIVSNLSKEGMAPFKLANFTKTRAPTSEMEKKLQGLWESVLSLEPGSVTLDDSFFVLGGDSVQSMRLVAAARAEQVLISVLDIFRKPNLADMASACSYLEEEDETVHKPFGLLDYGDALDQLLDEIVAHCQVEKEQLADAYPCSALQEGLFAMSIKQPGAYVAQNVFRLPEAVDLGQFKAAWEKAIEDMDILRTRIVHTSASAFVQVVLKKEAIEWHTADRTEDVINSPQQLPEHSGSPLMRFTLVNENEDTDRFFVWSVHHAIYDGWCMPRMLQRVEEIYFEDPPSAPKASYAQFIKYLSQADTQASDRFWQSKFDGLQSSHFPSVSTLDSEQPSTSDLLKYTVQLPKKSTSTGITLPTVIRAAWGILMSAHSGSEDIVFGETMTGRDIPIDGIIDMLGPTLTTVPTRIQVDNSLNVMQYLQKIHQMATEVLPYQHVGLQHIRRINEETAMACDFQNLLVIQTAEDRGESKMWDPQNTGVSENFFTYPLVVECNADGLCIHIDAHFNDKVISKWHVQRLLYQLESILGQLLSAPSDGTMKLSDVQVISEKDISMIRQWNSYEFSPVKQCIHNLFLKQAVLLPQTQAVCAWDGSFTYMELKKHATNLSKQLAQLGVRPESFVPFCMDKSKWAVVAQLGTLMAGGGVVPLDPAHPLTRHSDIINDTKARILLCSPEYQSRYSDLVDIVIPVDEQTMSKRSNASPLQATSKNTAYVIFTSGSTGRPKGVVVEHEAFCSSSAAYSAAMLMKPSSRVFNFASVTFDVGLMENLSPLTMGACVCIPNNEAKNSDVASAIDGLGATWAFLTPSVANLIEPAAVPSLKVLVCGGEAMSKENVLKWAAKVKLVNGYGPTEASVISVVNPHVSRDKDPSNIGVAHANGYAWVTESNDHNRLAPLGCMGELVLEGPLLAREYLHDKAKTAAAFIENPTWAVHTKNESALPRRFYKTGDLVRYNEDGSIKFIGRADNQIKLHGQRIELGEIEHKFGLHNHIQHVVVMLPKLGLCKQRLVAVVSMSNIPSGATSNGCVLLQGDSLKKSQTQMEDVREFLSSRLPPYMIPTIVAVVEKIPFMVSGKLDRKQVEKWVETLDDSAYKHITAEESNSAYNAAPITDTVEQLREIWASVFNFPVDKIDPGRSFMSQGGDSLISMSIIAKCRKVGIVLSLQEVLQSSSLFQLAKAVDSKGRSTGNAKALRLEEKTDQEFDLSPVQRLYFQLAGSSTDYTQEGRFNQSQLLRLKRKTETESIKNAVGIIVQQHSMFRARFSKDQKGNWRQRITKSTPDSFRFREHRTESSREILRLLAESQKSLDIENGPLFAVELFTTREYGQILSLIAHHLVIDVVSWNIIIQQLEDLLTFQADKIEKPLSFQVWCALQGDHASHRNTSSIKSILPFNVKRADTAFWGMAGRTNTYGDVTHQAFQLDKVSTELALGRSNKALGTQPIEILLSALFHSFRNVFTQRNLPTIYNESHGRDVWDTSLDITGTTGWFTSIHPIAISNSDMDESAIEILKRTKDLRRSLPGNGREYFAHRYLTPDGRWRFSDHMPMEILLNYTGQSSRGEENDNLLQPFGLPKNEDEERLIADVGPNTVRMALFEVSVSASDDQIRFSFMWNKHMQHQDKIRQWVGVCKNTLKGLAEELSNHRPEPTLTDFPLLPTTYSGLQKHVNETFREVGVASLDEVENMYITAPTQEGLLLSQIRNPHQYVNFVISEVKLAQRGARVDVQRLARSWQQVVDRHQSLRTAFVYSVCNGHAFDQIALKHAKSGVKIVQAKDEDYEKELGKVSLREINKTRRPALPQQLSICTTPSGKCYMKLELNHAVIDGGSGAVVTRDLGYAYGNRLDDGPKPLYSDYVKYIHSRGDADASHWKKYLGGIQRCYMPPLDPGPKSTNRLNAIYLHFNRFPELQAFCRANEITLSNVMLTAWGLVLRQYTSSDDVCFGNLTAGREAPVDGIQDAVGAFINMLVCRVSFTDSRSIKDIVRNVQSDYLESLPHQHCSLAKVQHDLGLSGEPLFNTAVSIQNQISTQDAEKEGDAIEFDPVSDHDPTEYAVTVNIRSALGDEGARIKHWTSLISVEEAEKLTRTYEDFLGAILVHADRPASYFDESNAEEIHEQSPVDEGLFEEDDDRASNDGTVAPDDASESSVSIMSPDYFNPEDYFRPREGRSPHSFYEQNARRSPPRNHEVRDQHQPVGQQVQRENNNSQDIQSIVRSCVTEVIEQMFRSGHLARPTENTENRTDFVNRKLKNVSPPNGKEPEWQDPAAFNEFGFLDGEAGPSETMSRMLRSLWSPLLDIPEAKIRSDDSFFVLGGDSILAMELTRAAREVGLTLTVKDIFGAPVFSEMAELMKNAAQKTFDDAKSNHPASVSGSEGSESSEERQLSRFSLLKAADTEAFIQNYICPKVGVFRSGIVDAFPVTDFQALAVTGTLVEARWMLNYLYFEGTGTLDLARLRKSATALVQTFDILRTVFIPCGNRFLQVVLRSLKPQISIYETDMDLDEYTRQLQSESTCPRLGEPYVQFMVIKKRGSYAHRIVLQISHAQYDGVCLPKIIGAFQASYEGRPIMPSPSFSKYIAEATPENAISGHYDYWKELLQGSSMTRVVERAQPQYGASDLLTKVLKKTIKLPSLKSRNITTATIIKAAWTLVLAQLSGKSDIVFGNLISGRNAPVEDVESIVGPCVNIIPVRLQLEPKWTALDLLRAIQNQQVAGMQYEALGFREIVQQCTDWPEWTFYSSIVQHQNLSEEVALNLDRTKYKVGFLGMQDTLADLTVQSAPKGNDMVEVNLGYVDDGTIPTTFCESALELLCTLAQSFVRSPSATLSSALESTNTEPLIQQHEPIKPPEDTTHLETILRGLKKSELCDIADTLTRAWRLVLPQGKQEPGSLNLSSKFWDAGGDIISLASLSAVLEGEGFRVKLEDLVKRPTIGEMVAMLCMQRTKEKSMDSLHGSSSSSSSDGKEETREQAAKEEKRVAAKKGFWSKPARLVQKMGFKKHK